MVQRPKFHLDESVPKHKAIAEARFRRGIDVTTPVHSGLRSSSDQSHFDFAKAEERVIISCDPDFLVLAAADVSHSGLIYYGQGKRSIGQVVHALTLLWQHRSAQEMRGIVEYV